MASHPFVKLEWRCGTASGASVLVLWATLPDGSVVEVLDFVSFADELLRLGHHDAAARYLFEATPAVLIEAAKLFATSQPPADEW